MTRHVISFDVEEYFHVETFRGILDRSGWNAMESRVDKSTRLILDLLDEAGVEATFFVLGWLAERRPELVREIASRGHEVASHGYGHQLAYALTRDEFYADVLRAREILAELSGQPVEGYRAPTFSITRRNPWALDALVAAGYRYDSSVFPIRHDRYGIPDFPVHPVRITWPDGASLDEYPMALVDTFLGRIPVAGGGYFRILPARILRRGWRRLTREGRASVFYLHPWEVDPDQPRLRAGTIATFRHYSGLKSTRSRLREWLELFDWTSFRARRAAEGSPDASLPREWFADDAARAGVQVDAPLRGVPPAGRE